MGRYTSQQAFADNNPSTRRIDYAQAVGPSANASTNTSNKLVTEKVLNPHGSTAGAGSSEFHIYRHARTREMIRWQELDQEQRKQVLDSKFHDKLERWRAEEEQATAKNRKKRQRQKEAKRRKKNMKLSGAFQDDVEGEEEEEEEEEESEQSQGIIIPHRDVQENEKQEATMQQLTVNTNHPVESQLKDKFICYDL